MSAVSAAPFAKAIGAFQPKPPVDVDAPPAKPPVRPTVPPIPVPTGPPVPALQALNFHGSLQDFNAKLEAATDAHEKALGYKPSPGLALNLATAPVEPHEYAGLFANTPKSTVALRSKQVLQTHVANDPDDLFVTNKFGMVQPDNPIRRMINQTAFTTPAGQPDVAPPKLPTDASKYIPEGFLPVPASMGDVGAAIQKLLQTPPPTDPASLKAYSAKIQGELALPAGTQMGGQGIKVPTQNPADLEQQKALHTVKSVQDYLKTLAPDTFNAYPSNGIFTSDWTNGLRSYMGTSKYVWDSLSRLATNNNVTSVPRYLKLIQNRQQAMLNQGGANAQIVSALPLWMNGDAHDFIHGLFSLPSNAGVEAILSAPLHGLEHVAKLGLSIVGGTVNAAKSQVAAANMMVQTLGKQTVKGNLGTDAAVQAAHKVLLENPTWFRMVYPQLAAHPKGTLKLLDQGSNLALDIIIGSKIGAFSEAVPTGNAAWIRGARQFQLGTPMAFKSMLDKGLGGVGEASQALSGAEKLNVAVAERIQAGEMNLAQYQKHVSELYAHGTTTVPAAAKAVEESALPHAVAEPPAATAIHGDPVFSTLLKPNVPNPSLLHMKMKAALDTFDQGLRKANFVGTDNAANLVSSTRRLVATVSPSKVWLYDMKAPLNLYNWTARTFNDRAFASQVRNDFVVLRAKEDIAGIQELGQSLRARYKAENPNSTGIASPLDTTGPATQSESFSYMNLPSGWTAQKDGFGALQQKASQVNTQLNKAATLHRRWIIGFPGLGESLFWKHAVADSFRRFLGGGGLPFKFGLPGDLKVVRNGVAAHFEDNPSAIRAFGMNRQAAAEGEAHYLTGDGPTQSVPLFNTADHLGSKTHMQAAGRQLRAMVQDDALTAYRQSSMDDLRPLIKFVSGNSFYEGKIAETAAYKSEVAAARGDPEMLQGARDRARMVQAEGLFRHYQEFEKAGMNSGLADPLSSVQQLAIQHEIGALPSKMRVGGSSSSTTDARLGKFVADNKIGFPVTDSLISSASKFDDVTSDWTGKLLTFNKKNRQSFYDNIFYSTVKALTDSGYPLQDAITSAMPLARAQTVYHMLDFSNMLQVEQNLRWLSYFATKHRLYWTWIGKQFISHPGQAAAIQDISQNLQNGSLPFTLFGHRLMIPAARLFWVNNTEYPETSPIVAGLAGAASNAGKGFGGAFAAGLGSVASTSGNVFTRNDQWIAMGLKLGWGALGHPVSYGLAVAGTSPTQRADIDRRIRAYVVQYRADNGGHYPTEADAVKHALLTGMANEFYRTNMFLPVLPDTSKPSPIQAKLAAFGKITNPKARSEFLLKNQDVQDILGAGGDQQVWLHEAPLWDQFRQLNTNKEAALQKLMDDSRATGQNVDIAAVKKIKTDYSAAVLLLQQQDAKTWTGNATYPAGRVANNGEVLQAGPWGTKLYGDPYARMGDLHTLAPNLSPAEIAKGTVTQTILDLQAEAQRIRQLGWQKLGYPDERTMKTRMSQIQSKIAVFYGLPKTASGKVFDTYYKQLGAYIKQRDAYAATLKDVWKTSSANTNVVHAAFRTWKEQSSKPVVIDGVHFPSLESYGMSQLPPAEYHAALAQAVGNRWQDTTGYIKTLLGRPTSADVQTAWQAYQQTLQDYKVKNPGTSVVAAQKQGLAKQIDKVYPGFYKDYLFAQQPKVERLKGTNVYQNMPAPLRTEFDQVLGNPAAQLAKAVKQNGNSSYYTQNWRNYVAEKVLPWLNDPAQAKLKAELTLYGGLNFLDTLPSNG